MQKVAVAVWKSSLSFTTQVHQHLQDGTTKQSNMSLSAEIATLDCCALTILSLVGDYPEKLSSGEENMHLCLNLSCMLLGSLLTSTRVLESTSQMMECQKHCAPMLILSKAIINAIIQLGSLHKDFFGSVAPSILQVRLTTGSQRRTLVCHPCQSSLKQHCNPIWMQS